MVMVFSPWPRPLSSAERLWFDAHSLDSLPQGTIAPHVVAAHPLTCNIHKPKHHSDKSMDAVDSTQNTRQLVS